MRDCRIIAAAIVIAAIVVAVVFRTDMQVMGNLVLKRDRWTGRIEACFDLNSATQSKPVCMGAYNNDGLR